MVEKLRARILAGPAGGTRPLSADEMVALAGTVDPETFDPGRYRRFQDQCYARNTVLLNEHVELVVICWLAGQASAVHDHGLSNCLYVVTEGEMGEERFSRPGAEGAKPEPLDERRFSRGETTMAAGSDIHRIRNLGPKGLVTVHIYSPPLGESMTLFTPIPRSGGA